MIPISDSSHKAARFPFVNIALILANIYVFYLQITAPDIEAFIYQYALVPANINFSNLETLFPFLSSMFLHGGLLHIGSNMLFLWVFGDNVEGDLNPFSYLFLYIGAGIVGSLAQYLLSPTSDIPMLGPLLFRYDAVVYFSLLLFFAVNWFLFRSRDTRKQTCILPRTRP